MKLLKTSFKVPIVITIVALGWASSISAIANDAEQLADAETGLPFDEDDMVPSEATLQLTPSRPSVALQSPMETDEDDMELSESQIRALPLPQPSPGESPVVDDDDY